MSITIAGPTGCCSPPSPRCRSRPSSTAAGCVWRHCRPWRRRCGGGAWPAASGPALARQGWGHPLHSSEQRFNPDRTVPCWQFSLRVSQSPSSVVAPEFSPFSLFAQMGFPKFIAAFCEMSCFSYADHTELKYQTLFFSGCSRCDGYATLPPYLI